MTIIQAIFLGIVQGLTEFIPVSSSGHLLLIQKAMGLAENGFTFDVALHIGTLMALFLYFYKDLIGMLRAVFIKSDKTKLAWLLIAATIPAAVIGYLFESAAESSFRSATLVSINLAVFGLIMLVAERYSARYKKPSDLTNISRAQALTMGVAQAAAIVPGISRSGSTITAGLFMGLDRVSATRFSFLLGIPITLGAILKVLVKHSAITQISDNSTLFLVGVVTAFVTGLFAIKFMLNYLSKHSLAIFAYYRFALATVVLLLIFIK